MRVFICVLYTISFMRNKYIQKRAAAVLTQKQADGIDALADSIQSSRSAAVRLAVEKGLQQLLAGYKEGNEG